MRVLDLTRTAAWLAGSSLIVIAGTALAEPVTLKIVHVNDLDRMGEDDGAGGMARFAAVVKAVREANEHVLVTHGGDAISPSLLSGFDQGAHMIDLLNQVGIDAMALGNHEFDFGPDVLMQRIADAEFPLLSNNATTEDGSLIEGVTESITREAGEHTVALFGLTTAGTAVKSSPGPITFADPLEIAAVMGESLRGAGADYVIALAHTDIGEDHALSEAAPVDLVLSGDDHLLQLVDDGRMALVESGSQAEYVTVVTVTMDAVEGDEGPEFTARAAYEVIHTADVEPDPELADAVAAYEAELSEELDIEIGTTETELDTTRATVRGTEAAFGNLVADAMREATGADVAITNGGGIRADRTYAPGTVLTRRNILEELPFGNTTILIEVSGADIEAALENGVGAIEEGSGRFPQVSGLAFTFDPAEPAGERVGAITIGDVPLDSAATYTLATNDFMGAGGDGYTMFADAPRIIDANAGELMAGQVIDLVESQGRIAPEPEGRIIRSE